MISDIEKKRTLLDEVRLAVQVADENDGAEGAMGVSETCSSDEVISDP